MLLSQETGSVSSGNLLAFDADNVFICFIIILLLSLICLGVKDAAHGEEREEKGKIAFFCGNPMVEVIKGIIHIYKNK